MYFFCRENILTLFILSWNQNIWRLYPISIEDGLPFLNEHSCLFLKSVCFRTLVPISFLLWGGSLCVAEYTDRIHPQPSCWKFLAAPKEGSHLLVLSVGGSTNFLTWEEDPFCKIFRRKLQLSHTRLSWAFVTIARRGGKHC